MEANWNREQLATLLSASHRPNESGLQISTSILDARFPSLRYSFCWKNGLGSTTLSKKSPRRICCEKFNREGGGGLKVCSRSVTWRYLIYFNGWLKVLQHGRTGRSSFTNNEPSRPGDVPRCSFTKQLWPPWDSSVLHVCVCMCLQSAEISPNAHSSVNAFPFPRIKK